MARLPAVWFIASLLTASAQSARAEVDCGVLGTVTNIHGRLMRAQRAADPGLVPTKDILALDTAGIAHAFRDQVSTAEAADLRAFVDLAIALAKAPPDAAASRLSSDATRAVLARAATIMNGVGCGEADGRPTSDPAEGTGRRGDGSALDQIAVFSRNVTAAEGYVGVTGLMLAACGAVIVQRYLALLRRRERRYPVTLPAHALLPGGEVPLVVVDISCNGAKIATGEAEIPRAPGNMLRIRFWDEDHDGQVAWSNRHYVGLLFARPFGPDDLKRNVQSERSARRRKANKKAAPSGAPLQNSGPMDSDQEASLMNLTASPKD